MPSLDVVVKCEIEQTPRVKQLSGMFDMPVQEKLSHSWKAELPLEERDWNVGLIVGSSGAGKSRCAEALFGGEALTAVDDLRWEHSSVIDDFDSDLSIRDITAACSSVGFNTIPSWMKPYGVLSNGEKFRVAMARLLLQDRDLLVIDEFTSIVDRQVAKIGSSAIQKYTRKAGKKFVAVSCHYDIVEWLQPDWVFTPNTCEFGWRSVQPRPELHCEISMVRREVWSLFAPYHYMSAILSRNSKCFGLWCDGTLAAFLAVLPRPVSTGRNKGTAIVGEHRSVTLPDWQGLGLHFVLKDTVAACYRAVGRRFNSYPAHPALIMANQRSPNWQLIKRPAFRERSESSRTSIITGFGGRPNAVFAYVGPAHTDMAEAYSLIA